MRLIGIVNVDSKQELERKNDIKLVPKTTSHIFSKPSFILKRKFELEPIIEEVNIVEKVKPLAIFSKPKLFKQKKEQNVYVPALDMTAPPKYTMTPSDVEEIK